MRIGPVNLSDVPAMVYMGINFHEEAELSQFFPLDPDHLAKRLRRMIRSDNTIILGLWLDGVLEGVAGFTVAESFFSSQFLNAQELFYWINFDKRGSHGKQLLDALETAARAEGCSHSSMIALETSQPERMDQIYKSAGYVLMERLYLKALN